MINDIKIFYGTEKAKKVFNIFLKDWISKSEASQKYDPNYKNKITRKGHKIPYHPTMIRYFSMLKDEDEDEDVLDDKCIKKTKVNRDSKYGKKERYFISVRCYRINLAKLFLKYARIKKSVSIYMKEK